MKKTFQLVVFSALAISLLFASCGPSKELLASEAKNDKLQKDHTKTVNDLNSCNAEVNKLQDENKSLEYVNTSYQTELKDLTTASKMTIADQAKRLKNLQNIIQSQKDVMENLKNSIANALMNYKTDELYVYVKDGNVYVSLSEKLLFKSGSNVIDPKGKEALKTLAKVLNDTKDISVMIEGHTDNVPIKTSVYKDNWDLSTARATTIVRLLTQDYGFDANRITASGKGKFHPIKTNDTELGRSGNRRTEVILSPDLKELFTLLNQ